MSVEERVENIIMELTDFYELAQNKNIDLIESDILDSFAFITLIDRLNEEFDIDIQPTTVDGDTWRSVSRIAKLVEGLIANK